MPGEEPGGQVTRAGGNGDASGAAGDGVTGDDRGSGYPEDRMTTRCGWSPGGAHRTGSGYRDEPQCQDVLGWSGGSVRRSHTAGLLGWISKTGNR